VTDDDRHRLLFGPYKTPRFRYGDTVFCERIGDAVITGLSDGPIPWPIGKRVGGGMKSNAILLYGDLVRAVRKEAAQAVGYWWGIGTDTLWKWRKALGVEANNVATRRLRHDYALEPSGTAALELAQEKCRDGRRDRKRRQKIAAAKRGKPRPPHVVEAVRAAHLGKKASEQARRRMSAAHKRRGTRPPKAGRPWTAQEDELVRTLPPAEVARRTLRTMPAVYSRRTTLELPDGRTRAVEAAWREALEDAQRGKQER